MPMSILGVSRDRGLDDHGFRELATEALRDHVEDLREARRWCETRLYRLPVDDGSYEELRGRIEARSDLSAHRLFYLAVPREAFAPIVGRLGGPGLNRGPGWTRRRSATIPAEGTVCANIYFDKYRCLCYRGGCHVGRHHRRRRGGHPGPDSRWQPLPL